ncbi:predicted protein [Nematostella vectensis]|uniref:Uncharacterized protein n=1 Tax=Nematostella vectensis TaxID=45351 RepID=A7SAE2_NEMVE|nr:predicted protein [Nematostella vectensis]|eukprot:XP_001631325.1 predicted protein [Nematostella vectensis]
MESKRSTKKAVQKRAKICETLPICGDKETFDEDGLLELGNNDAEIPFLEGRKINLKEKTISPRLPKCMGKKKKLNLDAVYSGLWRRGSEKIIEGLTGNMVNNVAGDIANMGRKTRPSSVISRDNRTISTKDERPVFAIPKVESYDILTSRSIIDSSLCYIFTENRKHSPRRKAKMRPVLLRNDSAGSLWKGSLFSQLPQYRVEWRQPSPVEGVSFQSKEMEWLEDTLREVEACNTATNTPPPSVASSPRMVRKFVVRLPPI